MTHREKKLSNIFTVVFKTNCNTLIQMLFGFKDMMSTYFVYSDKLYHAITKILNIGTKVMADRILSLSVDKCFLKLF